MTNKPKAYKLAETQSNWLKNASSKLKKDLQIARRTARLDAFLDFIIEGQVAINTSLSTCLKILDGGSILTAHEAAELN